LNTDPIIDFYFEKEEENSEEQIFDPFYRIFLVIRKQDTLQEENILAEMHLVLELIKN